jgi:transcriptional regulator with XRE-family HTH domain
MNMKVTVTFEAQGDSSYSCIVNEKFEKFGLIGYGSTARAAEADVHTALSELKERLGSDDVPQIEISRRSFDVPSFFSYYPYFNITQLAKFAGLNAAQVRQYASGIRKPTKQKLEQLNEAVKHIAETFLSDSRAFSID